MKRGGRIYQNRARHLQEILGDKVKLTDRGISAIGLLNYKINMGYDVSGRRILLKRKVIRFNDSYLNEQRGVT